MNNIERLLRKADRANTRFFKHFVLALEKAKFKIIDSLFPNYKEKIEKKIQDWFNKQIAASKTDKEFEELRTAKNNTILAFRKEYEQKQNNNYHLNVLDPQETIDYLEWNKQVHKNGLIKNIIVISIALIAAILSFLPTVAIGIIILETLGATINAECINLQNKNIKRIEKSLDKLQQAAQRKSEQVIEQYGDGIEAAATAIQAADDLSKIGELFENMTPEQKDSLYAYLCIRDNPQTSGEKVRGK